MLCYIYWMIRFLKCNISFITPTYKPLWYVWLLTFELKYHGIFWMTKIHANAYCDLHFCQWIIDTVNIYPTVVGLVPNWDIFISGTIIIITASNTFFHGHIVFVWERSWRIDQRFIVFLPQKHIVNSRHHWEPLTTLHVTDGDCL